MGTTFRSKNGIFKICFRYFKFPFFSFIARISNCVKEAVNGVYYNKLQLSLLDERDRGFALSRDKNVSKILDLIHTETFSCVFVLFQVISWLFSIPLRTVNNTKT